MSHCLMPVLSMKVCVGHKTMLSKYYFEKLLFHLPTDLFQTHFMVTFRSQFLARFLECYSTNLEETEVKIFS